MDIHFSDPNVIPLPPEEVRIKEVWVEPYPDKKRVRIFVELTPFQKNPSGDVLILSQIGEIVASASFIEAVDPKFDFTMHLKESETGKFIANIILFYTSEIEERNSKGEVMVRSEKTVVDQKEKGFQIED